MDEQSLKLEKDNECFNFFTDLSLTILRKLRWIFNSSLRHCIGILKSKKGTIRKCIKILENISINRSLFILLDRNRTKMLPWYLYYHRRATLVNVPPSCRQQPRPEHWQSHSAPCRPSGRAADTSGHTGSSQALTRGSSGSSGSTAWAPAPRRAAATRSSPPSCPRRRPRGGPRPRRGDLALGPRLGCCSAPLPGTQSNIFQFASIYIMI